MWFMSLMSKFSLPSILLILSILSKKFYSPVSNAISRSSSC